MPTSIRTAVKIQDTITPKLKKMGNPEVTDALNQRLLREVGSFLRSKLRSAYNTDWGKKHTWTGGISGSIRYKIQNKSLRVGIFPVGDSVYTQSSPVRRYAKPAIFGWTVPPGKSKFGVPAGVLYGPITTWAMSKLGLNKRDARRAAVRIGRKWRKKSRVQSAPNFLTKVFNIPPKGDSLSGRLKPRVASEVRTLISDLLQAWQKEQK